MKPENELIRSSLPMAMRRYLPLLLTLIFLSATLYLIYFKPKVNKRSDEPTPIVSVETLQLQARDYLIVIESFGRVAPRTQGQLIAQVSGQIVAVNPNFRDGGFFQKGEVLIELDARDYRIEVEIAAAELANAKVKYAEEQVLSKQAIADRKSLPNKAAISDFALHLPQLEAAKAQVAAANAKLEQATINVERTRIRAPYSGRILTKSVDIGEVVTANTSLAAIYATDQVEIRLPVKNSELAFLDLPEQYASGGLDLEKFPAVTISNRLGTALEQWPARLVSTAGAIDEQSQQLHVTARIEHPYQHDSSNRRQLKIGQYVSAAIEGITLRNALVIPNAVLYQGSYVYLFADGVLQRREVEIAWQNQDEALVSYGLAAGEQLVLTPLGQVSSGTRVKLLQESRGERPFARTGGGKQLLDQGEQPLAPAAPDEQHGKSG